VDVINLGWDQQLAPLAATTHGNAGGRGWFQTLPPNCARRPVAPLCARRTAVVEIGENADMA
jgi:hypothetical protein